MYPVGSLYMSFYNTSPAKIFGGTWEQACIGRTLMGVDPNDVDFNDSTRSGGVKTNTVNASNFRTHIAFNSAGRFWFTQDESAEAWSSTSSVAGVGYDWSTATRNDTTGVKQSGRQILNNLPPYQAVYIWKRIA